MWDELKLFLKYRVARSEVEKEIAMGYDVKLTLLKGLKTFALSALAIGGAAAGTAIFDWLANDSVLTNILQGAGASAALVAVLVPLLHAGIDMARNWLKHRNDAVPGL